MNQLELELFTQKQALMMMISLVHIKFLHKVNKVYKCLICTPPSSLHQLHRSPPQSSSAPSLAIEDLHHHCYFWVIAFSPGSAARLLISCLFLGHKDLLWSPHPLMCMAQSRRGLLLLPRFCVL